MTSHESRDPRTGEGQYDPKGGKTDPLRHPTPAPKPVPLPTDDCPKRSDGGSCLCVPACARCHIGPHMPVHDPAYAWMPGAAPYNATKHAVVGFVRSVAPTLERRGIQINAVCPGIADTAMLGGAVRERLDAAGFPIAGTSCNGGPCKIGTYAGRSAASPTSCVTAFS